jgi:hypothetical protein
MSNYTRVLEEFRKLGYDENTFFQQNEINRVMDTISSRNTGSSEFDRSIAEELWTHCNIDPMRGVKLQDYINTIVEAEHILREQVSITEKTLRMETRPTEKSELQNEYSQILSDHRIITSPFGLPPLRQANTPEGSRLIQNQEQSGHREGDTVIFAY